VLVTKAGDILYISGKTGKYLEPAAGKANWNLFAMARESLAAALTEAFHKAVRHQVVVTRKEVPVGTKKDLQATDITVQPVTSPGSLQGLVMVVFTQATKKSESGPRKLSRQATTQNVRLSAMAQDLRQAHEDLQATRDEMQTSQEEIRSTNEELQSMNEELQSTNEELTTSKEEMQSMNEELQTVNHELQAKVDELSHASDDMKNLLDSTDIATLFLDKALLVRRFTSPMASIIKLIPSDIGRPISDIVTTLDYPLMVEAAKEVVRKQVFIEKHVPAEDGRWFTVRIMPYRTQENQIAGAVLTFTNITKAKKLEAALRKAESVTRKRLTTQTVALDRAEKTLLKKGRPARPAKLLGPRASAPIPPKKQL
jgi:two-component system CheB/CheR fusion protein